MSLPLRPLRLPSEWVQKLHVTRDTLLFIIGAVVFLHEAFIPATQAERPTILFLSAAMMGLPLILRAEDRIKNGKGGRNGER